jgi:hypothetical protein
VKLSNLRLTAHFLELMSNSKERDDLITNLYAFSRRTANFLISQLEQTGAYSAREFYGTAFTILLLSNYPEFTSQRDLLVRQIKATRQDPLDGKYHWEFVRFALEYTLDEFGPIAGSGSTGDILGIERFVGTRVANWTMLRSTCRLYRRCWLSKILGGVERTIALLYFQRRGG